MKDKKRDLETNVGRAVVTKEALRRATKDASRFLSETEGLGVGLPLKALEALRVAHAVGLVVRGDAPPRRRVRRGSTDKMCRERGGIGTAEERRRGVSRDGEEEETSQSDGEEDQERVKKVLIM